MTFVKNNKDLFKALANILDIRGIKVEYQEVFNDEGKIVRSDSPYIGSALGAEGELLLVRPAKGWKFGMSREAIEKAFTPINIDGYEFEYEDFIEYQNAYDEMHPDMILFTVKKDGENYLNSLAN